MKRKRALTILELDCHRLIGAFHQKPVMQKKVAGGQSSCVQCLRGGDKTASVHCFSNASHSSQRAEREGRREKAHEFLLGGSRT